jgi:hypothetical protein
MPSILRAGTISSVLTKMNETRKIPQETGGAKIKYDYYNEERQ